MAAKREMGHVVGNLDKLDARFKCTHCHLLLRDAMQGDCGHRYCKNCVQIKFSEANAAGQPSLCSACDASERIEISPDRTYPDNAIKREISKSLKVQCPNRPCKSIFQLKELEEHAAKCEFKPQPCDLCGESVPAASLSEHKNNLCRRRLVPCDVCQESVQFELLAEHKSSTCIGSTVQCEFCAARVKDDEKVKDHHWKTECPVGWHEKNPCPFGCTEMSMGWEKHRLECQATHVDRLLAKAKQKIISSDSQQGSAAASGVVALVGSSSAGATGVKQSMTETAAGIPAASEFASVPYEDVSSLMQRTAAIEGRLKSLRLPAAVLAGEAGDQERAQDYLNNLRTAVSQGDKLNELLDAIKKQFDGCHEKIRQYELKMQRDLEKKLDIERKHQELIKLLAYKEMKILDLERRVEVLEHAGYDGVLVWKIGDVKRRKEEAREGKVCSIYSPPFYTGKAGYKMCGRLYLNGDGAGKNTHISLFFVIMRGAFDALLPWPFSKKVSMMLLDQSFEEHVIDAFKPDTSSSSFKRPTTDMNIASGCPLFMPLSDFENSARGYVRDDTMFIKFIVDKSDLPT